MSRGTLVRILEAFFKRWYLYVLPLVAMIVLGLAAVTNTPDRFTSRTTVFVEDGSQVEEISDSPQVGLGSFLTPAQFSSQDLGALLATDDFITRVLETAGVDNGATDYFWQDPIAEARASLSTNPTSENHMQVSATTPKPELSQRLAEATIAAFIDFKIEIKTLLSVASEEEFSGQLDDARAERDRAVQALEEFQEELPAGTPTELLEAADQTRLTQLSEERAAAIAVYNDRLREVEAAQLSARLAETEVEQRVFVIDPPKVPTASDNNIFEALLTFATYLVVGAVLTVVGPVVAAMANRNVLFADDLAHLEGARVIGVVPRQTRGDLNAKHATAPATSESPLPPVAAATSTATPPTGAQPTPLDRAREPGLGGFEPPSRLDRIVPSSLFSRRESSPVDDTDTDTEVSRQDEPDPRRANG